MIVVVRQHLRQLVDAAEAAYPEECCGLLVGRHETDGRVLVEAVHPSANLAADRRRGFEVDPALRIGLERRLRGGPQRVVGIYHSHPDHPAQPSLRDLERAWEPDLLWVITAVEGGQAIHTTAHRLAADGSRFEPVDLCTDDRGPEPSP